MRLSLAVLLVLLAVWQQSQPPTPTPGKPIRKPESVSSGKSKEAESDHAPTEPPVAVGQSNTPPCDKRAADRSSEQGNKSTQDHWITWFTGVLAVVAVFQFGAMIAQFVAARRQAEYLRSAERAHIDLDFVGNKEVFTVMIANYGKSIANIVEYRFSHAVYALGVVDLSVGNASTIFEDVLPMNQVLPPTGPKEFWSFDIKNIFTEETRKNAPRVVLRGLTVYIDIFGKTHETEVLFESHGPTLKNLPEYNRYT